MQAADKPFNWSQNKVKVQNFRTLESKFNALLSVLSSVLLTLHVLTTLGCVHAFSVNIIFTINKPDASGQNSDKSQCKNSDLSKKFTSNGFHIVEMAEINP